MRLLKIDGSLVLSCLAGALIGLLTAWWLRGRDVTRLLYKTGSSIPLKPGVPKVSDPAGGESRAPKAVEIGVRLDSLAVPLSFLKGFQPGKCFGLDEKDRFALNDGLVRAFALSDAEAGALAGATESLRKQFVSLELQNRVVSTESESVTGFVIKPYFEPDGKRIRDEYLQAIQSALGSSRAAPFIAVIEPSLGAWLYDFGFSERTYRVRFDAVRNVMSVEENWRNRSGGWEGATTGTSGTRPLEKRQWHLMEFPQIRQPGK